MEKTLYYIGVVIRETPTWAYVVLALLTFLGVRRLETRPTTVVGLSVLPIIFLTWSVIGAVVFGRAAGPLTASLMWAGWVLLGLVSFRVFGPPRGRWINSRQFAREGSVGPLVVYLGIFAFRYGLEVWTGFAPEQRVLTQGLALTLSGFMSGRTLGDLWLAVARKRDAVPG